MAEAYLKKFGGSAFEVESAGLEPGKLNPLAIAVMQEDGIDISNNPTKDVFGMYKDCLLYTSPSPRDRTRSRMPSSA
mgnify:CR=1 FL=1